ncbi:MAG: hypothetical protein Q4A55_00130 [Aerococcus sp.]|nr:hypothetical protein [Aerococcus sp.]
MTPVSDRTKQLLLIEDLRDCYTIAQVSRNSLQNGGDVLPVSDALTVLLRRLDGCIDDLTDIIDQ